MFEDYIKNHKIKKGGSRIRNLGRKKAFFALIFILTMMIVFSNQVLVTNEQGSSSWFANLPIIKQIKHLAESADRTLKGEDRGRVNVLLLGMGGRGHEGGYLADTIMLASLNTEEDKVAMISIPRDLAVPIEDMGWRKINHVNAYAEMEEEGSGPLATAQAVSDILNMPIDYYVRVDFRGFVNIVNELGGLTIEVENTIDDREYPIPGREEAEDYNSRFEHLYIEKGWREMDGELALKYVRSRHSAGIEGSDFARARRQQNILQAVKDKALSLKTLLNPKVVLNIINELDEHVSTNLKVWEMLKMWDLVKAIPRENISSTVLDNSPGGLLVNSVSEEGAYILTPRSGDFSEIQYYANNVFSEEPEEIISTVSSERATIELRNGTWINGLASRVAFELQRSGFTIVRIGNSSRQNFQKSVIYDLTYGEKPKSLTVLKNKTGANVSLGLPQWLIDDISQEVVREKDPVQPDFILILGQNADPTYTGTENLEEE